MALVLKMLDLGVCMKEINEQLVREVLAIKDLHKLDKYISVDLFMILINMDEISVIDNLYARHKNKKVKEQIFMSAIECACEDHASETLIKVIELICTNDIGGELLFLDDREKIYYLSQYSGNTILFEMLKKNNIDLNWGQVLSDSCNFLQKDTILFLVINHKFSQSEIDSAFSNLVNSSVAGVNDPARNELISFFVEKMKPSINQKGCSQWEYLFLECFQKSPDSAYLFYTENFNTQSFESENFWDTLIEYYLEDEEKEEYIKAFHDLVNSSLDITYIESAFSKLGKYTLFEELTKVNS